MFPGALLVIPLKLETTQISFSGRAVTQTALHPYHGTLFLNEEDQTADVHNLEEFWKNHNECKTPVISKPSSGEFVALGVTALR